MDSGAWEALGLGALGIRESPDSGHRELSPGELWQIGIGSALLDSEDLDRIGTGTWNRIGTPRSKLLHSGLRDSGMGLIGIDFRILESGLWEQAFGIVGLELRTLESGLGTSGLGNESSAAGRAL